MSVPSLLIVGMACLLASFSASASEINSHELVSYIWLAVCIALVFFMQAGFALLEGGLVRAKNTINVLMKNYADMAAGSFIFWLFGFGIMFGVSSNGWFGLSDFMPAFIDTDSTLNLAYQTMFAATTATIVSGAVAERIRFVAYLLGACVIVGVIYPLSGHWIWGSAGQPGWLAELGFIDAAGSTAVHAVGGWCALGAVLALGPRLGRFSRKGDIRDMPGHNLPIFGLGVFILWFGWFGFNGGAAESDLSDLGKILLNTHLAGCAGLMSAVVAMFISRKPILMTHAGNGALGGLVAITAGCKVMDPPLAIATGIVAGWLVIAAFNFIESLSIDDVVGAIPVHGVCGLWGTIAAGLFFSGDLFNVDRTLVQFLGSVVIFVWAVPASWLTFRLIDKVVGLRVEPSEEQRGLDFVEHYEVGYSDFMAVQTHAGTAGGNQ